MSLFPTILSAFVVGGALHAAEQDDLAFALVLAGFGWFLLMIAIVESNVKKTPEDKS